MGPYIRLLLMASLQALEMRQKTAIKYSGLMSVNVGQ